MFIAMLHTWSRTLMDHPHLHCLVAGGGLSADGRKWIGSRKGFFVPVRVLSALYRGKFLAYFKVERLERCRRLLGCRRPRKRRDRTARRDWRKTFFELTGIDLRVCPVCGGRMVLRMVIGRPFACGLPP